jgi:hypothetical protein
MEARRLFTETRSVTGYLMQPATDDAPAEEVSAMIPRILGLLTATVLLLPAAARAIDIQEVTSPGGVEAWLVEDSSIPFVAIEIWFNGGASLDAPGKRGASYLMTGLLEEGAEDMDARAFAEAVEGWPQASSSTSSAMR